jgi:O-antigen/teichoic acid export membrane protein
VSDRERDLESLSSGAGTTLAGKLTGRAAHLVGQVFLARLLGPEVFGLYAIGWTVLSMARVIAPVGLENAVVRFAGPFWPQDRASLVEVIRRSIGLSLAFGLLVGGILFATADWLGAVVFDKPSVTPIIQWFALACPLATTLRVAAAATRVTTKMQYSVLSEDVGQPVFHLVALFCLQAIGLTLTNAVFATVASFAFAALLAFVFVLRVPARATVAATRGAPAGAREMLAFSIPSAVAAALGVFLFLIDRAMIAHFGSAREAGIYQAVSQCSMVFAVVQNAMSNIFAAMIPKLEEEDRRDRLQEVLRISTKWALYLCIPPFLVMATAPRELIAVLFGARYLDGSSALPLLAGAQLLTSVTGLAGLLLIMTGRQRPWLALTATAFAANVVANVILIPRYGMTGAAMSSIGSIGLLLVASLTFVRRSLRVFPLDRRIRKGVVAALASLAVLLGVRELAMSAIAHLVVATLASGVTFLGVLAVQGFDPEDRKLLARR